MFVFFPVRSFYFAWIFIAIWMLPEAINSSSPVSRLGNQFFPVRCFELFASACQRWPSDCLLSLGTYSRRSLRVSSPCSSFSVRVTLWPKSPWFWDGHTQPLQKFMFQTAKNTQKKQMAYFCGEFHLTFVALDMTLHLERYPSVESAWKSVATASYNRCFFVLIQSTRNGYHSKPEVWSCCWWSIPMMWET